VIKSFSLKVMCIVVLGVLISGCTTGEPGPATTTTTIPVTISTENPDTADCRLTPCHGLELTCGLEIPEVCTTVYQLGDKCRRFVRCTIDSAGTCQMVTTQEFTPCIACVRTCLNLSGNDPSKSFACEETC